MGLGFFSTYVFVMKSFFAIALISVTLLLLPVAAQATPYLPSDDNQILERLRDRPADGPTRELRHRRSELARSPHDLKLALALARDYIEQGRSAADPRYNGYAQAALSPWWNLKMPPAPVLVLRATLRQSNHDFDGALRDLQLALRASPYDAQAWVTVALIQQVQGDYAGARRSCVSLFRLSTEAVAVTCLAGTASLNGQAVKSYALLDQVLARSPQATVAEKLWAETLLAEIATRLARFPEAENHFRRAIALGPDSYLLGAYADFLLDRGRPQEVIALLKDQTRADNLLLRLAIAESAVGSPTLGAHVEALRARFAASRLRGDRVHQREEARFTLELLHRPEEALTLARENWAVQREPADVRILLASALAADAPRVAQSPLSWVRETRLEDTEVHKLVLTFGGKR